MREFLTIGNDGRNLVATNYWQSSYAKHGVFYFSVSGGCVRILVPPNQSQPDDEVFASTDYVIVTRGCFQGQDGYEVLFEDHSDDPFSIHVARNQWDLQIPAYEAGRTDLEVWIYKHGQKVAAFPARFRVAERLPYLKPWESSL